jgi:hypothetical protein
VSKVPYLSGENTLDWFRSFLAGQDDGLPDSHLHGISPRSGFSIFPFVVSQVLEHLDVSGLASISAIVRGNVSKGRPIHGAPTDPDIIEGGKQFAQSFHVQFPCGLS